MPMLKLEDADISYETAGERGPCLLLVQGAGAVGEGWRPQIDGLLTDHRLAWLDNRGIGGSTPLKGPVTISSMANDCLALLRHLGWERVHLIGHSMGGVIVQEVARKALVEQRTQVASLSLLSTARRGRDATRMSLSTLLISLRMRFGAERARWLRFGEMAFPPEYLAKLGEEELIRILQATFCRDFVRSPAILNKQVAALFWHTGGDMAPLQKVPTLIATGTLDRVMATRYSDDLLAHLPQARLERFADAGHAVTIQHAAAINRLLADHVSAQEQAPIR